MTAMLFILQGSTTLALAPLMVGFVRFFKARFQNRRGAPPWLPYVSLWSLFAKEMTITRYSSWVFRSVPFVVAGVAVLLAFSVPTFAYGVIPEPLSNLFFIGGLFALGSVWLVLGGMDAASTFGNMGSSREMTLAAFVEPALYLGLSTIASAAGVWSLDGMLAHSASTPWEAGVLPLAFTFGALLLVVLAENARYPVDNPATHLELTMVHEAMVLEYSGPYLAFLEYASAVKLLVTTLFLFALVLPFGLVHAGASPLWAVVWYAVRFLLAAFTVASIESMIVKMRFYRMQEYFSLAFFVALAGLALVLLQRGIF